MAKIKKKNLLRIGFDEGKALKLALIAMQDPAYLKKGRETKLELLQALLKQPQKFQDDPIWAKLPSHCWKTA